VNFEVLKSGDVAVVLLPGETLGDRDLDAFRDKMGPVLEGNAKVVFDMIQVRFIDGRIWKK